MDARDAEPGFRRTVALLKVQHRVPLHCAAKTRISGRISLALARSMRGVLFQGCLDRVGGGGLAQAEEDPSDAVLVADAATAELIVPVGACECAPPVLGDEDVVGIGAELCRQRFSTASTRSWPPYDAEPVRQRVREPSPHRGVAPALSSAPASQLRTMPVNWARASRSWCWNCSSRTDGWGSARR